MLLGIFMLGSCTNEMPDAQLPAVENETQDALISKTDRLYAVKKTNRGGSGMMVPQAVAVIDKLWTHRDTIKIKFLNGSQTTRAKVIEYGAEWLEYINLSFEYVGDTDSADVKIGFEYGDCPYVSWVTIGTDCKNIPQDEASINFVALTDENGDPLEGLDMSYIRADILRSYGAMLGLGFEHRSPNSTVVFMDPSKTLNRNRLIGYFGVSILQIIDEILTFYTTEQTKYTAYDGTSIMMLPMPGYLFVDPRDGTAGNFELSATDKCFIAALYPKTFDIEWVCDAFSAAGGVLCTDVYDNLYFFQQDGAMKLMKMDTQGVITELFTIPSQYLSLDIDLAVDNSGIIYLSNGNNGNMWQFSPAGTLLKTFDRQLSSTSYIAYRDAIGVLDNNQLVYVAGHSNTASSYNDIWSYKYDSGTDVSTPITPLPLQNYHEVAVASNNLVYTLGTNAITKLDANAGTYSIFTPAYADDDISNAAIWTGGSPSMLGLSASRDISDITFLRMGLYEVSPGCGQMRYFLFTYNPNCDSSCEVRNFGMLPLSITKPDGTVVTNLFYNFTASTRNGKITYVTNNDGLYKITNHR